MATHLVAKRCDLGSLGVPGRASTPLACPGQACPGQALSRPGLSLWTRHTLCVETTQSPVRAGGAGGRADSRKVWTCWFLHPPLILHTPKIAFPPLRGTSVICLRPPRSGPYSPRDSRGKIGGNKGNIKGNSFGNTGN